MATRAKSEQLAQQATFIFKGTVKKLKAATLPNVPVTEKTIIVGVDEILRAPDALTQYEGADITVQLGSRERINEGEQAVFYTNSWVIGEGLAVQSVGHLPVDAGSESAKKRGRIAAATSSEIDPSMQEQAANADVVVTGTVTSVRLLDAIAGGETQNREEQYQTISEHSPMWQEAVIQVGDVIKGGNLPKQLIVRFPRSTDVLWYDVPKLRPGQQAVFLLQKESSNSVAAGRARTFGQREAGADTFHVLNAAAVQPLQSADAIRKLIKATK